MAALKINAFGNLLDDLFKVITNRFREDRDVDYSHSQVKLAMSVSPIKVVETFMESARPYLGEILNKDEHFFLSMADTTKSLKDLKLGEKWQSFTTEEQDLIWKNIQKLIVLGNKICSDFNAECGI